MVRRRIVPTTYRILRARRYRGMKIRMFTVRDGMRNKQGAVMLGQQLAQAHGYWIVVATAEGHMVAEFNRPDNAPRLT